MTGLVTLAVLGLSLSVDAFAAAVGKGACAPARPRLTDALKIGAVFGFFEALTPAIGWAIGLALSSWIAAVDHWVAFGLLAVVGGHMLWQAAQAHDDTADIAPRSGAPLRLVLTALATSIDAMAVGVSLAVLDVDIVVACLIIGGVTTLVATGGVLLGRHAGPYLGRYAEVLGGVALIGIGSLILWQHLSGQA
ncbi:manganese efflux pump MntP [Glacieibacterium frigidum]|uniref:Putative manganese efflux pump MntP n=1 Tax=Glacieibacterium frigidum TaxID=2593303 RepID=A0A552UGY4_9SPHN|nr:manganese efflux pump MntP family protein [Glacieibacterium frigidum]TRW17488.1 manganese efflux pump [Glacieibacterium frigidum]